MKKMTLISLLFASIPATFCTQRTFPPHFDKDSQSKKVQINEKFTVYSRVQDPRSIYDGFHWKKADHWQLVSYPADAIELIRETATAPDGCGGDLLQGWYLKACKAGTFTLLFERYSEQATITIHVSSTVAKPIWHKLAYSAFERGKAISLENGDEHYYIYEDDILNVRAPWQHSERLLYSWKPEDRWYYTMQDIDALQLVDQWEYASQGTPTERPCLGQSWTFKAIKAGTHTLVFKHHSKEIVIKIYIAKKNLVGNVVQRVKSIFSRT